MCFRLSSSPKSFHHWLGTIITKLGGVAGYFRDCTILPKGITKELRCHLDTLGGPERSYCRGPDYTEGVGVETAPE